MASPNTLTWISKHVDHIRGHSLEVGSKRYKDHAFLDLRGYIEEHCPGTSLTGCDIAPGENVDLVVDLTRPFEEIDQALAGQRFDTVFCVSVLEHIPDVFSAARNIANLMSKGGSLFLSVPFVFRIHGYPGDFWRFTPQAIEYLFPDIDFSGFNHSTLSTQTSGEQMRLANNTSKINRFLFRPKSREDKLERKRAKASGEAVEAYSLAPCMFNMLGIKK